MGGERNAYFFNSPVSGPVYCGIELAMVTFQGHCAPEKAEGDQLRRNSGELWEHTPFPRSWIKPLREEWTHLTEACLDMASPCCPVLMPT